MPLTPNADHPPGIDAGTVDAIARRVVELLDPGLLSGAYLSTAAVSRMLDVGEEWVRDHAGELGAVRLGDGRRGQLRFDVERRVQPPGRQPGTRAALCLAGPRISELTSAPRARLDLHGSRLRVGEAKTEAGLRDIELTFQLQAEVREHLAHMASSTRSPDSPTTPHGSRPPLAPDSASSSDLNSHALAGLSDDGRGWFRTSDLSRMKRESEGAERHPEQGRLF